jgi:DNA ligase 1
MIVAAQKQQVDRVPRPKTSSRDARSPMHKFAETADRIAATTKKLQKTALLADYFRPVPVEEAAVAAVFFSGRPFPEWEETTLQVGGTQLWRIVSELSGKSDQELTAAYREHGDLGAVAGAVLPKKRMWRDGRPRPSGGEDAAYPPSRVQRIFREIAAARGPAAKGSLVRDLLSSVSPLEAKYIVKIITGDLRIGLKESLVEEAIAKAYEAPLEQGQRANMLLGDIGETLKLAAAGRLADAKMRLFHPIGFMLASPAESAEDAVSYFQNAWVEDKYDGIRAQAHCSGDTVRFFSRTRDEITESFPELPDALAGLPQDAILDGEIVAWSYLTEDETEDSASLESVEAREPALSKVEGSSPVCGSAEPSSDSPSPNFGPSYGAAPEGRTSLAQRFSAGEADASDVSPVGTTDYTRHFTTSVGRALPFSALQQRLGRKKVSEQLMQQVPVAYLVFDVLYAGEELLIDQPLQERAKKLQSLLTAPRKTVHHRGTETQRNLPGFLQQRLVFPAPEVIGELAALRTTHDAQRTTVLPTADSQEPRARIIRAPVFHASSPKELDQLFDAAQARGNEGLMIKDPESPYTPTRRGKSWLKLKRELATLDVVVTAVEWGHGKRIGVLSDYTFAVRDGDRLLNVGKAYSGLTDAEISEMTKWFLDHTIEDQGFRRTVEPKIVLEVAFNNVMKSDRHNSGYALRFPRIVRLRPDKQPEEVDTLQTVEEVYARQNR